MTKIGDWERVVAFHGHVCAGLAMGYRACLAGLRELGLCAQQDVDLVAIVDTDACGVDAVQVLTGCTVGKGNLVCRDRGKQAYTFYSRKQGRGVRVVVDSSSVCPPPEIESIRDRLGRGEVTGEELARLGAWQREAVEWFFRLPEERVLKIEPSHLEPPPRARIFNSVECRQCGERVMECRARVKEGAIVCLDCSERYRAPWPGTGS